MRIPFERSSSWLPVVVIVLAGVVAGLRVGECKVTSVVKLMVPDESTGEWTEAPKVWTESWQMWWKRLPVSIDEGPTRRVPREYPWWPYVRFLMMPLVVLWGMHRVVRVDRSRWGRVRLPRRHPPDP